MTRLLDLDALLEDARTASLDDAFFVPRLRGVDRNDARARVLARLRAPSLDQSAAVTLGRALEALDPTPALDSVLDVMADPSVDDNGRLACFQAIVKLPPRVIAGAIAGAPRLAAAVEFLSVYSTLVASHEHPEALDTLHELAKQVPAAHRASWVSFLETVRLRSGVPASAAYAKLLGDPAFAADDGARVTLLDAVVAEADAAGSALLQRLRAGAPKKLRAPFQVALLKLETARIGGPAKGAADKVRAWCSQPDGQGAVVALFAIANSDGTCTFVDLCFRLTRDLRQGFVVARAQEREIIETLRDLTGDAIEVARVPAGELAAIVDEAVASHSRMRVRAPAECDAPLRVIERLPRTPLPVAPAPTPTGAARVRTILREKRHTYWFFDDADLRANAHTTVGGAEEVLAALARSPMRARVEAMARFMVHWTRWRGDAAMAAEWAAIADEVSRDFAASALAVAMAEASPFARALRGDVMEDYGREGILIPLRELFPDVAARETKTLRIAGHVSIPDGEYRMEESFCTDRRCNCERVIFHVLDPRGGAQPFRIGHAFSEAAAKRFYGPQTGLDPAGGPPWGGAMAREVNARMKSDDTWRADVMRHYELARSL